MNQVKTFILDRLKERSTRMILGSLIAYATSGLIPVEIAAQGLQILSVCLIGAVGVSPDKKKD